MEKIDFTPIPDNYESVLAIPMFSYLIILDDQRNNIFSHSFDFESDEQCETFGFRFTKNNATRVVELNFLLDLIKKLLINMASKGIAKDNFVDFFLPTQYFSLLQFHGLYFIAVYSENDKKFSPVQKEFMQGSLRGIATTFLAICNPDRKHKHQLTNEELITFIEAVHVLVSQTSKEMSIRNCILCPPEKYCIPKLLLKNISPDYGVTSVS